MTSVQRVPVIEEVLSDSVDDIHILGDGEPQLGKSNASTREIINKFPRQNIKFTVQQVYLREDFHDFDVPDSSDDEAIQSSNNVNSTSNASKRETLVDYNEAPDSDDDEQFYIDEDAIDDDNTASDEPMDLSLAREDDRLSSISSSVMSLSSKNDDDKLSTVSSGIDTPKELQTIANLKADEEKPNNVFNEDMETDTTSDDELELAEGELQEISMPSRNDKQFRVRGKTHVETICLRCQTERRMSGKLWQNKTCRNCNEDLQFQCANCKKRYSSYHSTLCHLKKECLTQEFWRCPKCPYSVLEEKKLEDHIKKVHVNGKTVVGKSTSSAKSAEASYSCDQCHAGFKWKANYEKHKCRNQEFYRCQMCDYTNKIKNVVKRHFHNSHAKGGRSKPKKVSKYISKIDPRPVCVPDITNSSNINNETKNKTQEEIRAEEKRLNEAIALHCPKCSRNFEYTGKHIKKCETCERPLLWQCIPCNELRKSYCGIYEHLQNSCIGMLKSCKKCSKKFASDDLEKHQHICGQDLYLKCELCDYRTRAKGFFLKHVKNKHKLQGDEIRKWL